ncbi:hypothetical protein ACFXQA_10060 [Microbacterium sp. P07]|uniref:hypothetical protein n=1 Tax=Microbacterium sp. P07 TaxID=3366952 RepID=UPI00374533D7
MSHDSHNSSSDEGNLSRHVRGTDGQPGASDEHDQSVESADAHEVDHDEAIEAELEAESERQGPLGAIGASFSGPLPPASILRGYEELVPGSAADIIGAHVRNENARAGALTRLTRAESFGVIVGTLGAQVLTVGGLVSGVILVVNGFPAESLFGFIPAAVSSTALVVSAVRGNRAD